MSKSILCLQFACVSISMGSSNLTLIPPVGDVASHVALVSYGSPGYLEELRYVLGGKQIPQSLDPVLPFSVVVRNVSSRPIVAVGVLFSVEEASGKTKQYSFVTVDLAPGSPAQLQPNQRRFVSMSGHANRIVNNRRVDILPAEYVKSLAKMTDSLRLKPVVKVEVDFIVTADGWLVGTDKGRALVRFQAERAANAWVSDRMLKASTVSQIKQVLEQMAAVKPSPELSPFEGDFYNLRILGAAKELSIVLERGGPAAVWATVSRWHDAIVVHDR